MLNTTLNSFKKMVFSCSIPVKRLQGNVHGRSLEILHQKQSGNKAMHDVTFSDLCIHLYIPLCYDNELLLYIA